MPPCSDVCRDLCSGAATIAHAVLTSNFASSWCAPGKQGAALWKVIATDDAVVSQWLYSRRDANQAAVTALAFAAEESSHV